MGAPWVGEVVPWVCGGGEPWVRKEGRGLVMPMGDSPDLEKGRRFAGGKGGLEWSGVE